MSPLYPDPYPALGGKSQTAASQPVALADPRGLDPDKVLELQRFLVARGYSLKTDGIWGPLTHAAYVDYEDRTKPAEPTLAPPPAKPWYASKTLLGILASLVALIAGRWGLSIDSAELSTILLDIATVGGLVVAFIGRVRAQASIDPRPLPARPDLDGLRLDPSARRAGPELPAASRPGPLRPARAAGDHPFHDHSL